MSSGSTTMSSFLSSLSPLGGHMRDSVGVFRMGGDNPNPNPNPNPTTGTGTGRVERGPHAADQPQPPHSQLQGVRAAFSKMVGGGEAPTGGNNKDDGSGNSSGNSKMSNFTSFFGGKKK